MKAMITIRIISLIVSVFFLYHVVILQISIHYYNKSTDCYLSAMRFPVGVGRDSIANLGKEYQRKAEDVRKYLLIGGKP